MSINQPSEAKFNALLDILECIYSNLPDTEKDLISESVKIKIKKEKKNSSYNNSGVEIEKMATQLKIIIHPILRE